jgi:ATP-dependent RNA helicase RhlE
LNSFKNGNLRVLVATDIAARGIDIDELTHVFNYDLPDVPETYIHRIGRTGRAGNSGIAISFCDMEERAELHDIEKLIGMKIPLVNNHPFPYTPGAHVPKKAQDQRNRSAQQRPRSSSRPYRS